MSTTVQSKKWIQLCHDDDTDGYQVKTKEGDQFFIDFDDLVRANRISDRRKEFLGQVRDLMDRLNPWLDDHADKIDRAYLSFGRGKIDFVVVQKSAEFDRAFDREFVDLDIEIARGDHFNLIQLECLALPNSPDEDVASFVPKEGTLVRRFT